MTELLEHTPFEERPLATGPGHWEVHEPNRHHSTPRRRLGMIATNLEHKYTDGWRFAANPGHEHLPHSKQHGVVMHFVRDTKE